MPNNIFRCVGNYYMITLEKLKVQMKRNNIYIYIYFRCVGKFTRTIPLIGFTTKR